MKNLQGFENTGSLAPNIFMKVIKNLRGFENLGGLAKNIFLKVSTKIVK